MTRQPTAAGSIIPGPAETTAPVMGDMPPFLPFGPDHLLALAFIAMAAVLLPILSRRLNPRAQHCLAWGMAMALPLMEIVKAVMRVYVYHDPWGGSLPLHLCGVTALLTAWMLWRRSFRAYEVAYFWALGGSIPALLTPDLIVGFPNPFFLLFFASHGLGMVGVLFATFVYGFRPYWTSLGKTFLASLLLMLAMAPVNLLLDANYLYLCTKPGQASLMDYLGPWPWYVPVLVGVGAVVCLACYLPFALHDACRRSVSQGQTGR